MSIEARLQRIERKLDAIQKQKPKWVRVSVITELTGWNFRKMASARMNGLIDFKEDNGYWYDLNSLHPHLIKKTA